MYKSLFLLVLFLVSSTIAQVEFSKFFHPKTLRIDYIHAGDAKSDEYFLDELIEEPVWGGSMVKMIDPFDYGKYKFEVYDSEHGSLIYSRTYSTLFSEWQTTDEAKKTRKAFNESVIFPYPKNECKVVFYSRDKKNKLHKKFEVEIDPKSYFIKKENRLKFENFKVQYSGPSEKKVDIVIIPEGYNAEQMDLFKKDCEKFTGYLFNSSPYKERKESFNVWGILAANPESGTDIPGDNIWKSTLSNTTFYTFDVERYLMTSDYKSVRDIAANAPYDQIYILVNTKKYGGGAIYNFYSVAVNKNSREEDVFVHEFGHGFAFLADEYYDSETAYQDFYPIDIEPLEANLTTLVDFDSKWKKMVDKNTPVPTPVEEKYSNTVGVFEGGGYVAKGVFRPMIDCSMKSASVDNYCPVCQEAIIRMIEFYSE
ncbi:MAG: peptidase M64 [Ignavibacteriales bacterium]|nr:peptidase M64 [Ignavibacteriales bacterium]